MGKGGIMSYLSLGRTYMFPENHHLSYIKTIYSIIIINNDHVNILYYIMPYLSRNEYTIKYHIIH